MTMGEFITAAINDKIPVQVHDRGSNNKCMTLSDKAETYLAECTILDEEKFTASMLAHLFLKLPHLVPKLMNYEKLNETFEDISYSALKALLGDQLAEFMSIIGEHENSKRLAEDIEMYAQMDKSVRERSAHDPQELAQASERVQSQRNASLKSNAPKAPHLIMEFAKEHLIKSSCGYYVDLSDLEKRNNDDADFVYCLTIDDKKIEGEYNERHFKEISSSLNLIKELSNTVLDLHNQPDTAKIMRQKLREEILKSIFCNNSDLVKFAHYPLPRADKWAQQDLVIATLKVLENAAFAAVKFEGPFANLKLDKEITAHLLPFKTKLETYSCSYPHYLALPREQDHFMRRRYSLPLPNGEVLAWSSVLVKYIEHYNIMPSRDFLNKLTQCRILFERHYQALILLVAELNNLSLIRKYLEILPDTILERLRHDTSELEISEKNKAIIHDAISLELAHRINESISQQSLAQFEQLAKNIKADLIESLRNIIELLASIDATSICYPQVQLLVPTCFLDWLFNQIFVQSCVIYTKKNLNI
jgi:hypothetical protein